MLEDLLQRKPYNAAVDFVDANVARGLGHKVAFIDPTRSLTYGELQARTYQFAAALRALGLRQEDRLLLLLPDTVDYPVAFWGAVRAGIIAIPLNTLLSSEVYAYIMADSRATAMVAAAPLARNILPILDRLPRLRTIVLAGANADDVTAFSRLDVHHFDDLLARPPAEPFSSATLSDEVAFWMYTSGSTGDPKGVKHVHTTPMCTARLMGQRVIGIRPDDVKRDARILFCQPRSELDQPVDPFVRSDPSDVDQVGAIHNEVTERDDRIAEQDCIDSDALDDREVVLADGEHRSACREAGPRDHAKVQLLDAFKSGRMKEQAVGRRKVQQLSEALGQA